MMYGSLLNSGLKASVRVGETTMKKLAIMLCVIIVPTLTACEIRGPSVKLKPVVIDVEGGGTHCPPGQAKKGNC
jgi:hypothetical protein